MSVKELSGVVLSQNQKPGPSDKRSIHNAAWQYQEFYLPDDYRRGTDADETLYPDMTGFQLLVDVAPTYAPQASLEWKVEVKLFGAPWQTLRQGVTIGSHVDGTSWFDVYFDQGLPITPETVSERFRIGFRGRAATSDRRDEIVPYDGEAVIIDGTRIPAKLSPNAAYSFTYLGQPSFLYLDPDANAVTFSVQQGVTDAWFSLPNPLVSAGNAKAYGPDGTTPLTVSGQEFSFCFRVLGLTADDGVDFLGNPFRSAVVTSGSANVTTTTGAVTDKIWLSGPQPSRFAVVSQYFDESDDGVAQTIDKVLLDPITPGMYFHVYYSNEGDTPTSLYDWENKLWTLVPRTYHATKRDTYALPEPITAKYVKIEYSMLQAQSYSPGNFEQPIIYKKYPKWVLDYFLARTAVARAEQTDFVANRVGVVYNVLDLAYNYYLDDLKQEPDQPVSAPDTSVQNLERFLGDRTDVSDLVDPETMAKIDITLKPYLNQPALNAKPNDFLLGAQAFATALADPDYPTERDTVTNNPDLLALRDASVVFENTMPVMFFYLTCRHRYREVSATLTHDRAYFAGVREVAFTRERYTIASDSALYIESGSDFVNAERYEF